MAAAREAAATPPKTATEAGQATLYLLLNRFRLFDADQDGAMDANDWLEMHFASYAIHNVNNDGRITLREYIALFHGADNNPTPLGAMMNAYQLEEYFNYLDKDKKGYLEIYDFYEEAMQSFHKADADDDGFFTEKEHQDALAQFLPMLANQLGASASA